MAKKHDPFDEVTKHDVMLVTLLAQGFTDKEIAEKKSASIRTVEGWVLNLRQKVNCKTRAQLANEFCKRNLI